MKRRTFGPLAASVPVIGQGTWNIEAGSRSEAAKTLRAGIDLGMTHIDTAEMYGAGESEKIVAQAIAGRRDDVFLVSKVLPQNATESGTITACEDSLARLGTDRLDCYLLHWRGAHPLEDTVSAFERLRTEGKIVSWGVSNFDVRDLEELARLAPPGHIACNQVLYHREERAIEHAVIPWCEAQGVAVVAYSPFGSGKFPREESKGGRILRQVAHARGIAPRQLALAFLTRSESVFVIPKAADPAHAAENAAAGDLQLTPDEIETLTAAFPLRKRPRSLPMI